jgi:hypothetical protein
MYRGHVGQNMQEGAGVAHVAQRIEAKKKTITRLLQVVCVVQDCQFAGVPS